MESTEMVARKHSALFTVHRAIDSALIYRGDEIFQSCKTEAGARALADLLNRAVAVANDTASPIVSNADRSNEIVAAAVARALDWRLEFRSERDLRLASEDGEAQRRKGAPRTANPHAEGTKQSEWWDSAWQSEDDRQRRT
jgi:hypothetical protein